MSSIKLPEATISYCETLWVPKRINADDKEPKYSCVLAFDPGTDLSDLNALLKKEAVDTFGANFPPNGKWPLRKGEEVFPNKPEFAGKMVISSATPQQPTIVYRDDAGNLQEIIDRKMLYAGCRVEAYVGISGYNKTVNKGVGIYVNGILKVADGEHLDGRKSAQEMFGETGAPTQQTTVDEQAAGLADEPSAAPAAGNPWD